MFGFHSNSLQSEIPRMNETQISRRHHHVPKLYLKRWCGRDNKVTEFKRFTSDGAVKSDGKTTKYTGFGWNTYDLTGLMYWTNEITRSYMEDVTFKQIDQNVDAALENLSKGIIPTASKGRSDIAIFLVSLLVRNPWFFRNMKTAITEGDDFQAIVEALSRDRSAELLQARADRSDLLDLPVVLCFEDIMLNKNIVQQIINWEWKIVERKGHDFLTSDLPVWWSHVPGSGDYVLVVAISPSLALIIANSNQFLKGIINKRKLGEEYNSLICKQAFDMVFGDSEQQHVFIENRLGRSPDFLGLSTLKFMDFYQTHRLGAHQSPMEMAINRLVAGSDITP